MFAQWSGIAHKWASVYLVMVALTLNITLKEILEFQLIQQDHWEMEKWRCLCIQNLYPNLARLQPILQRPCIKFKLIIVLVKRGVGKFQTICVTRQEILESNLIFNVGPYLTLGPWVRSNVPCSNVCSLCLTVTLGWLRSLEIRSLAGWGPFT